MNNTKQHKPHTQQYGYYPKKRIFSKNEKPYRYQYKIDNENKMQVANILRAIAAMQNKPIKHLVLEKLNEMKENI